ncbi:hypothetical protein PINS_up004900 [Pythium insidiosum]|nr:hypothetical protein PINS_up004900 [Pythium insidiosum]
MEQLQRKQWTGGELLVAALLQLVLVRIAYKIDRSKRIPLLTASTCAVILGMGFGLLLSFISRDRARDVGIDPTWLFFGLLPPIILEGGFSTQHRGFFANFWDISLLGILGTLVSTAGIATAVYWLGHTPVLPTPSVQLYAFEAILFGALISAIDPIPTQLVLRKSHVPPLIPELVFGERSLNNAFAIAIFDLCQQHKLKGETTVTFTGLVNLLAELLAVAAGSLALAVFFGFSSAYLLQHPTYEISILLLFAYASYLAGEVFQLSGDLAVFFSGAFIQHYHLRNVSKASAATFRHLLRTLAFLAENFIFIYLGVSVFAYADTFAWEWRFIAASLVVCLVVRGVSTFTLCGLANLWRVRQMPASYMVVIWLSGLRGAIAFALSLNIRHVGADPTHDAVMRGATIAIILTTTFVFSLSMGPLVQRLGLAYRCELHSAPDGERTALISPSDEEEATWIRDAWEEFDQRHLQPLFGDPSTSQTA